SLATFSTAIAIVTTVGTFGWLGRPFPGFFVMHDLLVPSVGLYEWTGLREGVPFHALVVAVDGTPVATHQEVYDRVVAVPVGTPVRYTLEKGGQRFERTVPTMRFGLRDYALTFGLFVLNGLFGIVAGTVVALLRPRNPAARAFQASFGFLWALFPLT